MTSRSIQTIQSIVQSINYSTDLSEALDGLVYAIHRALDVDVCSIYLHDEKAQNYKLMATHGLNPDAVGKVSIGYDEGLVGFVAERFEPVNIGNARKHPRFKFIPDAKEEDFLSFLGVPVIQHGELLAVLVVQQRAAKRFKNRDIAFLTTLAALIAGNIVVARAKGQILGMSRDLKQSTTLFQGLAGAPGISIGTGVVVYSSSDINSIPDKAISDFVGEELLLGNAIKKVVAELQLIRDQHGKTLPEADRMLFDAYAMIANDEQLFSNTVDRIRAGNWAQGALRDTILDFAKQFEAMDDAYLRERGNDIRDIGGRIVSRLQQDFDTERRYPEKIILIGENLSPLDLASIPPGSLVGLISGHGSAYSHLAILAHALNIPAVLGFSSQIPLATLESKKLVIDGYAGYIHVSPNRTETKEYLQLIEGEQKLADHLASLRDKPAMTKDGLRIHLYTNSGLLSGFTHAFDVGTEGIGLFRTELPFMNKESFPVESEQYTLYREVLETYSPRPVTLRLLDIGGDKSLPYFPINEANPFLGWRGIRILLDQPEILLVQVRAMLRANEGLENLRILLPMVSNLGEIDDALSLINQAREELLEDGLSIPKPEIGVMIEVPSTIFQIPALAKRVDFLSLGTNDLVQYLLAIDRNNERVAKLHDPLHPAVLAAIEQIALAAKKSKIPLSICGEAAGDPAMAMLLIALEIHSFSLSAGDLPRIKWLIRTISHAQSKSVWKQVRKLEHASEVRHLLNDELVKYGLGALLGPGQADLINL